MKSRFAKFIDATVGAVLIFFAATAVMRYYTTLELAAFSAVAVTACALLLLGLFGKKREQQQKLSDNAEALFFELMFMSDRAHAKLLFDGLGSVGLDPTMHGNGVYTEKTAAYTFFAAPPDARDVARAIAKAKHYGAAKAVMLCKTPPKDPPAIDGFDVDFVCGEDVYKLLGGLGALPRTDYAAKSKKRSMFSGALGKDKILRYSVLSAAMFAASALFGFYVVPFACACVCAVLAVAAVILNVARAVRSKRINKP